MPFQIVNNPQLQALKKKHARLPRDGSMGLPLLGSHHITHNFGAQADGSVEISLADYNNNDHFSITIFMSLVSFHIELQKSHSLYASVKNENANVYGHKLQCFSMMVGDLFKLHYKNNSSFFERNNTKKNKKREVMQEDEEGEKQEARKKSEWEVKKEEDDINIAKLTTKAVKASGSLMPHQKHVLGSMVFWGDSKIRLWNLLTKEGKVANHRSDFVNFCSMLVVLPIFSYDPKEILEDQLQSIPTFEVVKKLTRYYLFGEDPEVNSFYFGYSAPSANGPYYEFSEEHANLNAGREYFEQPKSFTEICEAYPDDFYESAILYIKNAVTGPLNQREKSEIETKYNKDIIFDKINSVEAIYPIYALRTIYLESWCKQEDSDTLIALIRAAERVARSDKCKLLIQKRGKIQKFDTYGQATEEELSSYARFKERRYKEKWVREQASMKDQRLKPLKIDKYDAQYND